MQRAGGKFIEDKVWANGGMGHCGRIWVGAEGWGHRVCAEGGLENCEIDENDLLEL